MPGEEQEVEITPAHKASPTIIITLITASLVLAVLTFVIGYNIKGEDSTKTQQSEIIKLQADVAMRDNSTATLEAEISTLRDQVTGRLESTDQVVVSNSQDAQLKNCFTESSLAPATVRHNSKITIMTGFKAWLPEGYEIEGGSKEYEDYVIIDSTSGRTASVNLIYLDHERLSSRYLHSQPVIYNDISNTWWIRPLPGQDPEQCKANTFGQTRNGSDIYLTQDGDVGAFFKVFTVMAEPKMDMISGYPDALQVTITGDGNDPEFGTYEVFEEKILEILYNLEGFLSKG